MKVRIPSWQAFEYVSVHEVTEWKDGAVYKTRHKGYAKESRPKQDNEVYASISTKLLKQEFIELDLLD